MSPHCEFRSACFLYEDACISASSSVRGWLALCEQKRHPWTSPKSLVQGQLLGSPRGTNHRTVQPLDSFLRKISLRKWFPSPTFPRSWRSLWGGQTEGLVCRSPTLCPKSCRRKATGVPHRSLKRQWDCEWDSGLKLTCCLQKSAAQPLPLNLLATTHSGQPLRGRCCYRPMLTRPVTGCL